MILAPRYDGWFAPLVKVPAKDIPQERAGQYSAGVVVSHRRDEALIVVDMGGGYGGPLYEHLEINEIEAYPFKGAETSQRRTVDGKLKFTNKRTAALWGMREALDPGQPGGSVISLPPDQELLADLTAPTFEVTPQGIKAETKEKVCDRLGRSTDKGDAVCMAWYEGPKWATAALDWIGGQQTRRGFRVQPQVIQNPSGRQPLSARR